MRSAPTAGRQEGQASVELLGLLPVLVAAAALAWQLLLAGQAWWLTRAAAQSAARAQAVGGRPADVARERLPERLRAGLVVTTPRAGGVRVRVRLPSPLGVRLGHVTAAAAMEDQR